MSDDHILSHGGPDDEKPRPIGLSGLLAVSWSRRIILIFLAAGLGCGAGFLVWHLRFHWQLRNFREVEPSRIYAGGYQHPTQLSKLLREYRIRTVLSLRPDGSDQDSREQEVVASSGVRFVRVPILSGDTEDDTRELNDAWISSKLDLVYRAVEIMSDPENQPVFVHCWGGQHRTGAVIAVYRVIHTGWNEEDALMELSRWGGFANGRRWPAELVRASYFAGHQTIDH